MDEGIVASVPKKTQEHNEDVDEKCGPLDDPSLECWLPSVLFHLHLCRSARDNTQKEVSLLLVCLHVIT